MRHRATFAPRPARRLPSVTVLGLVGVVAVGCPAPDGPGDPDGGGPSDDCPAGAVDSTSRDTFFTSLACTYRRYAVDTRDQGDATFTHGAAYDVVIAADGTITFPADQGDIVFTGGQYEDVEHETNVLVSSGTYNLVLQWDKGEEQLELIVSEGQDGNWRFEEEAPPPLPGPLDATDERPDLHFVVGTYAGEISFISSDDNTQATAHMICDVLTVTVDDDAQAVITLGSDTYTLPYDRDTSSFAETPGGGGYSFSWAMGEGETAVSGGVSFELDESTGDYVLYGLGLRRVEGTYVYEGMTYPRNVSYSARPDEATCP